MTVRRFRHASVHGVTRAAYVPPKTSPIAPGRLYLLSPEMNQLVLREGQLDGIGSPILADLDRPRDLTVDSDGKVWAADAVGLHRYDARLALEQTVAAENIVALVSLPEDDLLAIAYADGRMAMLDLDGAAVTERAMPWVFARLLWSVEAGLVGVTTIGSIVRLESDLALVLTDTYEAERPVQAIRDLRSAVLYQQSLVLVGGDRLGNGSVTTYDLATDTASTNRDLAASIILAASTLRVGTRNDPDSIDWLPWHLPVVSLDYSSAVEHAIGEDEVWIYIPGAQVVVPTITVDRPPLLLATDDGDLILTDGGDDIAINPQDAVAQIELSCATEGATIWYTTDGSTPIPGSASVYTDPFLIFADTAIRAIATLAGVTTSAVAFLYVEV